MEAPPDEEGVHQIYQTKPITIRATIGGIRSYAWTPPAEQTRLRASDLAPESLSGEIAARCSDRRAAWNPSSLQPEVNHDRHLANQPGNQQTMTDRRQTKTDIDWRMQRWVSTAPPAYKMVPRRRVPMRKRAT